MNLVTCESCRHFTRDAVNPRAGIGSCAAGAWADSQPAGYLGRTLPPYPRAERYCAQWGAA